MTVRPILRWPHQALRTPAAPVGEITDEIRTIWQDMVDTMEAMPGVGLAAPQIGVGLALAVVDASPSRGQAVRMANPELLQVQGQALGKEASPCLPGVDAKIERGTTAIVRFINPQGQVDRRVFEGMWARSALHQLDHLAGRMYFDNLSKLKRDMLLKKARKAAV